MLKRLIFAAAGVFLVGLVVAAPYFTVHQMRTAARDHDGEAFSEHVDFPSVRQSLKDQVNAALLSDMASDKVADNPFAAMGAALAGVIVDRLVEAYVTPAGISRLMSGESVDASDEGRSSDDFGSNPWSDATMSYESLSKFVVTVNAGTDSEGRFVLRRRGVGWKLTEILIPLKN